MGRSRRVGHIDIFKDIKTKHPKKIRIMKNLKRVYRDLEMRVLSELRDKVNNSNIYSKHVTYEKCIEVNVFDYTELVIVNDKLVFLDDKGYQYSLWNGDCNIEDLIDILNKD